VRRSRYGPYTGIVRTGAVRASLLRNGNFQLALKNSELRKGGVLWIARSAALLALIAIGGFLAWRAKPASDPGRVMLAVLPFESASDDSLVDGLADELISHLGSVATERLGVIARSSVMRYRSSRPGVRDVARDLGVQYILEGTIRRDSGRVRMTARLVKAADQSVDWTESYEDAEDNLFRLEEESAAHITAAVLGRLFPRGVLRTGLFHVTDRAAYEAYRTGRTLQFQGSLARSLDFFEEAVRVDPRYADAYAALADACVSLARMGAPPETMFPRAASAAEKALELNSSSHEAHNALANVRFWFDWNWSDAEQHFRIALRTNPSYAEAHHDYAWFLVAMGRTEEGLTSLRRAIELDPFSVRINMDAGWLLLEAHRFEDAIKQARHALELSPGLQEAQACIERAHLYQDRREVGPAGAADPYSLALHYALSGDKVRAIRELKHAYESRSVMMPLVKVDPAFTSLRGEPAFEALVAQVGIP